MGRKSGEVHGGGRCGSVDGFCFGRIFVFYPLCCRKLTLTCFVFILLVGSYF